MVVGIVDDLVLRLLCVCFDCIELLEDVFGF